MVSIKSSSNVLSSALMAAVLMAASVISCGGGSGSSSSGPAKSTAPTAQPSSSPSSSGSGADIHVVLTGGQTPGTYDIRSAEPCTGADKLGLGRAHLWGWLAKSASNPLSNFSIAVDTNAKPYKFTVVAAKGQSDLPYQASTILPSIGGEGTAAAEVGPEGLVLMVSGTTKEGYGIEATARCHSLLAA